ncbi:9981_t:CDS:10, partial [Dentiscutata heterogama]
MAGNEIKLLEYIEFQFGFAENEVQFEEMLEKFLSLVLKKLASPYEIAIDILNHINKRMTKTVKFPWNSLNELVCSENFMNSALVKNFTIIYLKKAYDRLTEKDKITYLVSLIKNIELKPPDQKGLLLKVIFELLKTLNLKFADLEIQEVVDNLYNLYESGRLLSNQKGTLYQSQSLKSKIMDYLCKSKLAANLFPEMLHVSLDCLYSPKTEEYLQKQGVNFIQWITRTVDISKLELIGKSLLFYLLKIIKETKIENYDNLMTKQEINKELLFKLVYGPVDLSIHNSEDNECSNVIIIQFQEINQLDQFDHEKIMQEMLNILEETTDKSSHMINCCILNYAFSHFQFAPILKKIKSSSFSKIANLIHEKYIQCTRHCPDEIYNIIPQSTINNLEDQSKILIIKFNYPDKNPDKIYNDQFYTDEIYDDQFLDDIIPQSAINNSKGDSKNLIIISQSTINNLTSINNLESE